MYLTDATEENLEQVLVETKKDLFRKTTGITTDDFRYLKDIGLIKINSIDTYVYQFTKLENQNFEITRKLVNKLSNCLNKSYYWECKQQFYHFIFSFFC